MGEERQYDLVVLGATGYTGQYITEEVNMLFFLFLAS